MDSRELRLGVWINHHISGFVKVTPNTLLDCWEYPHKYEPIKLTPEIMANTEGCDEVHKSVYTNRWEIEYNGRYIGVSQNIPANTWVITFVAAIELLRPELHLLQNVIFCNWGKPLQISLTNTITK